MQKDKNKFPKKLLGLLRSNSILSNELALVTHYLDNESSKAGIHYESAFDESTFQAASEFMEMDSSEILTRLKMHRDTVTFKPAKSTKFTFVDLFAGIGGFRLAMQDLGGKCIFSSEIDPYAQLTYFENFGEVPFGDISLKATKDRIPRGFDLLCAGFPCQAFSIAGKRNGFEDARGTLFFEIASILKTHEPKAFFLENVKGLINHRGGSTLKTILKILREDLNYFVPDPEIVNAKYFGVPQNRERVFILGFKNEKAAQDFDYPTPQKKDLPKFKSIKERNPVPVRYYMSDVYLQTLVNHKARHKALNNGFGYQIIDENEVANALIVGGMGRERNLIYDDRISDYTPTTHIKGEVSRENIRRMTPREWARLQGFPDEFTFPVADVHKYKQLGNSVAVPAIKATAEAVLRTLSINSTIAKENTSQDLEIELNIKAARV